MSMPGDAADPASATAATTEPTEAVRPRPSVGFSIGLALIAALGLAVRVAFVAIRQSKVVLTTGDAYWYHWQGHLVSTGRGFLNPFEFYKNGVSAPGADHPPGHVLLVALLDGLGIDSAQGQRYALSVLGTLTIVVIGLVGRRIGGARVGLIAAFLAAVYPNIWINDGMLMAETPFLLGVALSFLCTYNLVARPTRWWALGLSASLTVAAMTRPETIVLFPFLLVPLVLARRQLPLKERFVQVVLAALVPIVAFAPWVAYNLSRYDEPVLLSTGAGQTLAVGNCDLTYDGDFLGFYNVQCLFEPQITPPTSDDPSVRDPEFRAIARDYISDHKGEVPKVVAARVGRMWHLYRVDQGRKLDGWIEGRSGGPPGSGLQPVDGALAGFYLLTPLAVVGLWVLRRRRVITYPFWIHAALATFTAATTFGVTRYRVGADLAAVVLAAVAIDAILLRWGPGARRRPDDRKLETA